MDNFFGFSDPFAGFGGFGTPGSLMSSFLGGRDPFDDPFFTNPFGSMFGLSMLNASPFGAGAQPFGRLPFGSGAQPFGHLPNAGYLEAQAPQPVKPRGPVIREITSDGEEESQDDVREGNGEGQKEINKKHSRPSLEPALVQDPDEAMNEKRRRLHCKNSSSSSIRGQPQAHSYTFQSTKVTYGGPNGAYYTASTTRRTGGDGVAFEESKEADTTTGKATHRILKGLHNKGHSVTRRLNSDGRVDTVQTLYNLTQDEIPSFEKGWTGNAKRHIPGWNQSLDMMDNGNEAGQSSSNQRSRRRGWALPSAEQQLQPQRNPNARAPFSNPSNRRV